MPVAWAISATTTTLIVAIAGIVVSGLLGPAATAWATRRANGFQFDLDQRAKRRDDFRSLVDEAGRLLGAGVTNLRMSRQAKSEGESDPDEVKEWASKVHLLKQRLLLRRSADDEVMTSYAAVLEALANVGAAGGEEAYDRAVTVYEQRMDDFLESARTALDAPVR